MTPAATAAGTEAEFQAAVIQLARLRGWMVAHFHPVRLESGRVVTPVAADGAGWPDLVLVKPGVGVLFWELKRHDGRLSVAQRRWMEALTGAGAEHAVLTPHDWPLIEAALRRRP